jgi:hypothetical protein
LRIDGATTSKGALYWYATNLNGADSTLGGLTADIAIDASRSSPVYGKSNTVQPQSIKYYYYIVVGTVSKTSIQVDIDNIATDLNNKADRSLSNVDNTANILMAHNAMPSNVYDDLTLGASGSTYTAPADGYFFLDKSVNYVGQWIYMTGVMGSTVLSPDSTASLITFVPVQKGQQITINYTAAGNTNRFMFIYAVGSESEKV